MIALSIAIVIVATQATWLINKWLNHIAALNKDASSDALSAATDELSKKFDARINKAFENHQLIKTELDSLKLQIGLKGNR